MPHHYIYEVCNTINGMRFIGQTYRPMRMIEQRMQERPPPKMESDIKEHGWAAFKIRQLQHFKEDRYTCYEVYDAMRAKGETEWPLGYNTADVKRRPRANKAFLMLEIPAEALAQNKLLRSVLADVTAGLERAGVKLAELGHEHSANLCQMLVEKGNALVQSDPPTHADAAKPADPPPARIPAHQYLQIVNTMIEDERQSRYANQRAELRLSRGRVEK